LVELEIQIELGDKGRFVGRLLEALQRVRILPVFIIAFNWHVKVEAGKIP